MHPSRVFASGRDVGTCPDADRLLETANDLRRLLDEQYEVGTRMARFGAGLRPERVADHEGASEFAGKRLEPARCIHGGADDCEFEPVEADVPKHDLAIVQSDADLDRRLVAILSFSVQLRNRSDHTSRATQGIQRVGIAGERRAERRHQAVAEVLVERSAVPEHFAFHSLMELSQRADDLRRVASISIGSESYDIGKQYRDVLGVNLLERLVISRQLL